MKACAGDQPAARRALEEALLDEERLDDLLDGVARLRQRRGERLDADRPAAIVLGDDREIAAVHGVEAGGIHFELRAAPCRRACGRSCRRLPTWAKSRTRRSSRPAMRGVPRERRAISLAPSGVMPMPSTRAPRLTISSSSASV